MSIRSPPSRIHVYTKSGSGPSKNVGTGECVIGIGFLHDGITQIVDNGYGNVELIIPSSGTSYEIGATAIFKGAKHPNAAKLWIEFALSPDCVNLAQDNGSYQFLVIDNATQPAIATEFGLDPENVMDYDFEDAKQNITTYVEEVFTALGGGDEPSTPSLTSPRRTARRLPSWRASLLKWTAGTPNPTRLPCSPAWALVRICTTPSWAT